MKTITQCPQCGTRFKVSQAQMDTHLGMVRCGCCHEVFNAIQHLHDDQPSPQLILPILTEGMPRKPIIKTSSATSIKSAGTRPAEAYKPPQQSALSDDDDEIPELFSELSYPVPVQKKYRVLRIMLALLLFLLLLAQALYFFRIELAARLPGLKPTLVASCKFFKCSIPLPKQAELISIESSELEANPIMANVITLNLIMRNNAAYTQAYPQLELTLTDTSDQALARRTFFPLEYLKLGEEEKLGLAGNREASTKLHLDTADLKPSGYRLLLFYPG